jgi:succinate dehydrogenase/fumarate reductase flavoprotein subunit
MQFAVGQVSFAMAHAAIQVELLTCVAWGNATRAQEEIRLKHPRECDLLVIGSGAAGLTAAITAAHAGLSVLVIEKEPWLGGATARSGGGLWIPGNPQAAAAGVTDTRDAALTYIKHLAGPRFDSPTVNAFLDRGPEMVRFMERGTAVRFQFLPGFPDYYPDEPGGMASGRSIFSKSFDGKRLGARLSTLRPTLAVVTFGGMQVAVDDLGYFMTAGRSLRSALHVAGRFARVGLDWLRARRTLRLTGGNALVGALLVSAWERGVEILANTPAVGLLEREGRIVGASIRLEGRTATVHARRGVVLATGGFPHDSLMRARLFPAGATNATVWGLMPFGNSGDGIRLGEGAGGYLPEEAACAVALAPVMRLNCAEGQLVTFPVWMNRGAPGILSVTSDGKRFVNEARSYHEYGLSLIRAAPGDPEPGAWMIADHRAIRRFGLGCAFPFPLSLCRHLRAGHLKRGRTLAELAAQTGIAAATLRDTVDQFNRDAAAGVDREFQRGSNAYDLASVEPGHTPNPCLGPLERPPYYAIKVYPGCVGTFTGLQTNEHAQVILREGCAVEGLYAIGNDMMSITGGDYIGGGCTIGPGMTFGYIAARHAAAGEGANATQDRHRAMDVAG